MENKKAEAVRQPEEQRRRPYSRPVCHSEQIFEVTALACGKIPGQSVGCNSLPSAS
jgi:hypothetical protein